MTVTSEGQNVIDATANHPLGLLDAIKYRPRGTDPTAKGTRMERRKSALKIVRARSTVTETSDAFISLIVMADDSTSAVANQLENQ